MKKGVNNGGKTSLNLILRKIEMNTDKSFQCKTMGLAFSPNEF
jgi:hypothetical protein